MHRAGGGEGIVPNTLVLDQADVERMISAAAQRAAKEVSEQALSRDDVDTMIEHGIERFLERVGIDDIPEFRKDLTAMRAARETREALISHGLKAVVTILAGGIVTAIWLAIKGAK